MRLCALGVSMVGALILTLPIGWFIFIIYLPTLIHVYVFTALFILFGASKNHDKMGYWSVLCLLVCGTLCFILPGSYHASQWAMNGYNATFGNLSMTTLENVFGLAHNQAQLIYTHPLGLGLGRFIGFAYTYHYLNWFSKTKVIGWHNISVKRLSWVIVFWIACISIYLYDYLLGFKCLFALSFLHVVLEFPLNAVCVSGIYKNIKNKSPKLRD
jgi:hypothetical protein